MILGDTQEGFDYLESVNVGFRLGKNLFDACTAEADRQKISFSRFLREALREKLRMGAHDPA